jgi:hypothetical protein
VADMGLEIHRDTWRLTLNAALDNSLRRPWKAAQGSDHEVPGLAIRPRSA